MNFASIPFLSPNRVIIIMMDDGVCVHKLSGSDEIFLGTVPWRRTDFEEALSKIISDSGAASVLILNDAVEQHYRKEKIVIPTSFDRANIIKRRLNVAFPSYPMRAAIELKGPKAPSKVQNNNESAGKSEDKEEKGNFFLFAAAPSTETFSRVVRCVAKTDCNLAGYGLLPVESAGLLKSLSEGLAKKAKVSAPAAWTILVGQHRGGGLRQIVVRGSELALTRVTPIDEPKAGHEDVWAADVSSELQATLSYLSRFGYSPDDGLNIIVLGDTTYAEILNGMIAVPSNFHAISPYDAAKLVGIKLSFSDDSHFSDGLHAAWAGKKFSLSLPLLSREISEIAGPRKIASVVMVLLTFGIGGALFGTSSVAQKLFEDSQNLDVAKANLAEIERISQEEIKRKEEMGIDISLIKSSLEISERIEKQHENILSLLKEVGRNLGHLRLDEFNFKNEGDAMWSSPSPSEKPPSRKTEYKLMFSFAGNINPKDGNKEMDVLVRGLNEKLQPLSYQAEVSVPLQNLTFSGEVDREVGVTAAQRELSKRYNSEVLIKKVEDGKSSGK